MTFEKALEAMKQGKKITYEGSEFYYFMSGENEIRCINFVIGYETTVKFFCSNILSDKWEIYEEPLKESQKEHEMAVENDIEKYNNAIRSLHILLAFKDAVECLERDTEPEHKCNACDCNCGHTGKNSDLQVKMERALSRKFFELEKYSDDESTINSMLKIYNSIFSD